MRSSLIRFDMHECTKWCSAENVETAVVNLFLIEWKLTKTRMPLDAFWFHLLLSLTVGLFSKEGAAAPVRHVDAAQVCTTAVWHCTSCDSSQIQSDVLFKASKPKLCRFFLSFLKGRGDRFWSVRLVQNKWVVMPLRAEKQSSEC